MFDSGLMVTRKYLDEGNRLYSSFQPVEFMTKLISGKFEILEYLPGYLEKGEPSQDTWLLRKI